MARSSIRPAALGGGLVAHRRAPDTVGLECPARISPTQDIDDHDLFYFDPDTRWPAENAVIRQAGILFADLPVTMASDGIDRLPCKTTAISLRRDACGWRIYASFGVGLALDGVLVPIPALPIPGIYATKIDRWQAIWPKLVAHAW